MDLIDAFQPSIDSVWTNIDKRINVTQSLDAKCFLVFALLYLLGILCFVKTILHEGFTQIRELRSKTSIL